MKEARAKFKEDKLKEGHSKKEIKAMMRNQGLVQEEEDELADLLDGDFNIITKIMKINKGEDEELEPLHLPVERADKDVELHEEEPKEPQPEGKKKKFLGLF